MKQPKKLKQPKKMFVTIEGETIWGIGQTPEEALKDGVKWAKEWYEDLGKPVPTLYALPATPELVSYAESVDSSAPPMILDLTPRAKRDWI